MPIKHHQQIIGPKGRDKEKVKKYNAERRKLNPEKVKEQERASREKNPEKYKKLWKDWAAANKERRKLYWKKYRDNNKEMLSRKQAEWREKNIEKMKELRANWVKNNPDKARLNRHQRIARKKHIGGSLSKDIVGKLLTRQKGKCAICGMKMLKGKNHIDHIMPLALGGKNADSNVQLTCPKCNWSKGSEHPVSFMQKKGYLL